MFRSQSSPSPRSRCCSPASGGCSLTREPRSLWRVAWTSRCGRSRSQPPELTDLPPAGRPRRQVAFPSRTSGAGPWCLVAGQCGHLRVVHHRRRSGHRHAVGGLARAGDHRLDTGPSCCTSVGRHSTTHRSHPRQPHRSRLGSCPSTNGSSSPTCDGRAGRCGRSPPSWVARQGRSAGSWAATA